MSMYVTCYVCKFISFTFLHNIGMSLYSVIKKKTISVLYSYVTLLTVIIQYYPIPDNLTKLEGFSDLIYTNSIELD